MTVERTQQVIEENPEDHDRGLTFDINTLMSRRKALGLFALGGVAVLAGCGSSSDDGAAASTTQAATTSADTTGATATATDVSEIPEETGGPYPADGSNGPNVLSESGVVRSDITTSFGDYSGTAEGVPLTINLTILDVAEGGTPLAGAAVYLWHCDRAGAYSLYSQGATDQNYLRGVQEADAAGKLTFQSIFPACYAGPLAPHPLRGLPQPRRGDGLRTEARHLPDRPARGHLRRGLRHHRLRAERLEPGRGVAGERHGLLGRLLHPAREGERIGGLGADGGAERGGLSHRARPARGERPPPAWPAGGCRLLVHERVGQWVTATLDSGDTVSVPKLLRSARTRTFVLEPTAGRATLVESGSKMQ